MRGKPRVARHAHAEPHPGQAVHAPKPTKVMLVMELAARRRGHPYQMPTLLSSDPVPVQNVFTKWYAALTSHSATARSGAAHSVPGNRLRDAYGIALRS